MTFLEMVQKAVQWSGARSTEPTTLVGATGAVADLADFVSLAWEHTQIERKDWYWNTTQDATGILELGSPRFFLRGESAGPKNIIEGKITYDTGTAVLDTSAPEDIQYNILRCKVLISEDDVYRPENELTYIPWDHWPYHNQDADDETGEPKYYTMSPSGQLVLHPIADQDYRLYFRAPNVPQVLSADADQITGLPEYLYKGLIWKGILYYADYIQDANMINMATKRFIPYKKWLERGELPIVRVKKGELY